MEKYHMIAFARQVLCAIMAICFGSMGYSQQKQLTEADYHRWGNLDLGKLSDKGNWVSYTMRYDDHPDTLFVKSTVNKKQYKYGQVSVGEFGNEKWFAFQHEDATLSLVNTDSGKATSIAGVEKFSFMANGYLVTLEKSGTAKNLAIRNNEGKLVKNIPNITGFSVSPDTRRLLYAKRETNIIKMEYISLDTFESPVLIIESAHGDFTKFEWQKNSKSVAFIHQRNGTDSILLNDVYHYVPQGQHLFHYSAANKGFPAGMRIADPIANQLTVAPDGSKVFFGIEPISKPARFSTDSLQIWNGNDKWIYPERKVFSPWEEMPVIVSWTPANGKLLVINESRPQLFFSGDMRYAISYNKYAVGPQYKLALDSNYFLTNLQDGTTTPWLFEAGPANYDFSISPDGKYLAYFRDNNYWVYHFDTAKHTNATGGIDTKWRDEDSSGVPLGYGIPGWGNGGQSLLLHDEHDLWTIDLQAMDATRLTKGAEAKCVYRKVNAKAGDGRLKFVYGNSVSIDLSAPMELSCNCGTKNSFLLLESAGKMTTLDIGEMAMSQFRKANHGDTYIYSTQRLDRPADVRVSMKQKPKVLFQSNSFHDQFAWSRQEAFKYKNAAGQTLNAILNYPAGYDPAKKYPMIVSIYEKMFYNMHKYENPSLYNMHGFNRSNMTLKGYFVLQPDIVYDKNEVGLAATDCTVSAVKAVIDRGLVDPGKVGLNGASFGGYETNFIITQTNTFAAAISGCGIADITGHYLSVGWTTGHPEIFRYENQQWRIGKSLFEDRGIYERNSPVVHAANVTTPLLLWAGEEDRQVHYFQSIAYYLALRRLNKKQMLLIYPKEGHVLFNKKFQTDLTHKMEQWWDHYLKDLPQEWITKGTK